MKFIGDKRDEEEELITWIVSMRKYAFVLIFRTVGCINFVEQWSWRGAQWTQIVLAEKSNLKFVLQNTFILLYYYFILLLYYFYTQHMLEWTLGYFIEYWPYTLGSGLFCKIQHCLVALVDELEHFMVLFHDRWKLVLTFYIK